MTYRSFHAAAKWTFSEGERPLRRVRYREPPEGGFLGSGTGQKCVSSPVADEAERLPANGHKAEAPQPAVETRHCEACDADFRPPAHGRAFAHGSAEGKCAGSGSRPRGYSRVPTTGACRMLPTLEPRGFSRASTMRSSAISACREAELPV